MKTCENCAWGRYHRPRYGSVEYGPPEAGYYTCRLPGALSTYTYDPNQPDDQFHCARWQPDRAAEYQALLAAGQTPASAAALIDVDLLPEQDWCALYGGGR